VDSPEKTIEGPGYRFTSAPRAVGNRFEVAWHYVRDGREAAAADVARLVADHRRIEDSLEWRLTHRESASEFEFNGIAAALLVFGLIGGVLGAVWLNRAYDPVPPPHAGAGRDIGGWLVLPAFGMVIRPVTVLFSLLVPPDAYFDLGTWVRLLSSGPGHRPGLAGLMAAELFMGGVSIALWTLLALQFFRRRSSLPHLFVYTMAGTAAWVLLDAVAAAGFAGTGLAAGSLRRPLSALIGVAIWVPYFLRSRRVRETFVVTRRASEVAPPQAHDTLGVGGPIPAAADVWSGRAPEAPPGRSPEP